jgi:hypothetical protein
MNSHYEGMIYEYSCDCIMLNMLLGFLQPHAYSSLVVLENMCMSFDERGQPSGKVSG